MMGQPSGIFYAVNLTVGNKHFLAVPRYLAGNTVCLTVFVYQGSNTVNPDRRSYVVDVQSFSCVVVFVNLSCLLIVIHS